MDPRLFPWATGASGAKRLKLRMETRASYVLVGSFVLALAAVGAVFVIWLAKVELDKEPTRYVIYSTGSVTGLQIGSAVRYRGVPVGSVSDIRIDPDNIERIRVLVEITEGTPIREDTVATLGLQGITGVAFIQLSGGTHDSAPLKPTAKGVYPEIPHETSGLEQVLEKAPELFSKAVLVADRLSMLIDDKNLSAVRKTLENLQNVTDVLADRTKNLDTLIVDAGSTLTDMSKAARDLSALTTQLAKETKPITTYAGKAMKELQVTIKTARGTLRSISGVSTELKKLVAENRTPLRDFSGGGLYELGLFVSEARVLVSNLTRLSSQIERDPARFFFGDTQKGFEAK